MEILMVGFYKNIQPKFGQKKDKTNNNKLFCKRKKYMDDIICNI